jgi:thiol:disulfide interchange protein
MRMRATSSATSALLHACVVTLLAWSVAHAAGLPDKFDPRRDAAADVAHAVALAKAQGKRVLVDVGGEWCAWCHIMDRFFAADAEARNLRERGFVWVKVNWSPDNKNEALLSRWPRIDGYPHLFVLGPDGTLLHSQDTGDLEKGRGYDRDRFIAFLRKWSP